MQLTGGQYKGRKIITPKGVRPTLAIVRESVFNVLNSYFGKLDDKKMLDMFTGSGIMTFEAFSRRICVTSYEINPSVIKIAKQNYAAFGTQGNIIKGDCIKCALSSPEKYDIIYADPPWDDSYEGIFRVCSDCLLKDGVAVVECDKKKKPDILKELDSVSTLELFKEKNYGRCCLLFVKLR